MIDPALDEQTAQPSSTAPIWRRHRGLAIAAVAAVILLITVLTDLPTSTSRGDDIASERSLMTEVNSDLAPCALALNQAIGIWNLQAAHQLTAADRAPTPGLLSDDQSACSFTSEDIYDLANIEAPGTPAGKHLGQMVGIATLWTTSDALRAIEDVQTLMSESNDTTARNDLAKDEAQLASDRREALAQETAADHLLATHLAPVDMPAVTASTSS
jgi:hypothetical protein